MNASIFFDLRPLYVQFELALGEKPANLAFVDDGCHAIVSAPHGGQCACRLMYRSIIRGDIACWAKLNLVDLKKYGSRIFVDAARIFALSSVERKAVSTSVNA